MKVFYGASPYRSLARAASQYKRIISETEQMTNYPDADIVILHCGPNHYESIYKQYPELAQKYVIGYAVWEADVLPQAYMDGLSLVQEVWTCSEYCAQSFKSIHPFVYVIPHIMARDISFDSDDITYVRDRIQYREDRKYCLCVTHIDDPRKNVHRMVEAFEYFHHENPECTLIVKGVASDHLIPKSASATVIAEDFTDAQLNALYASSSMFLSAHHSEGWGFAIADAVIFGLPVIATGYSGNLTYMDDKTAHLIPVEVREIEPQDRFGFFEAGMKWAYMACEPITQTLKNAYQGLLSNSAHGHASRVLSNFSEPSIAKMIRRRLNEIAKHRGLEAH